MEVHHQEPRHPYEDPLLLVMVQERPEEWYFRISNGRATAVCRIQFTGNPENRPARQIHPDDEIPVDVADALRAYDGEFSPVTAIANPTTSQTELYSSD